MWDVVRNIHNSIELMQSPDLKDVEYSKRINALSHCIGECNNDIAGIDKAINRLEIERTKEMLKIDILKRLL